MLHPVQLLPERWRTDAGRRAAGLGLALLVEALLVLLLLTLGTTTKRVDGPAMKTFDVAPEAVPPLSPEPPAPEPEPANPAAADPAPTPPDAAEPPPAPAPARPTPPIDRPVPPPTIIPLSREDMAAADLSALPARPATPAKRGPMGPPNVGHRGDSERVEGSGPNGEPLYAARWYREPYDDELSGYLSTARGPGWGLIACRTVANYRVEDCVALGEYPERSNIARSVLAAAWQFKVRPPQIGGVPQVGEWVRIRIDYGLDRR